MYACTISARLIIPKMCYVLGTSLISQTWNSPQSNFRVTVVAIFTQAGSGSEWTYRGNYGNIFPKRRESNKLYFKAILCLDFGGTMCNAVAVYMYTYVYT